MTEPFAVVQVRDIIAHGANAAIVLSQIRLKIRYAGEPDERGRLWYTPPKKTKGQPSELQRLTGFGTQQIRRAVAKLIDEGAVIAEQRLAHEWDQRYSYRVVDGIEDPEFPDDFDPQEDDSGDDQTPVIPEDPESTDRSAETAGSSLQGQQPTTPQSPPYADGSLLGQLPPEQRGSQPRPAAARRARSAEIHPMAEAQFATWYERLWPPNSSGDRHTALRAFAACLDASVTVAEIEAQTRNYVAGLDTWFETFGERRKPMSASRFLCDRMKPAGGKRHQWTDPKTAEELASHWPPPDGRTWERPKRRRTLADLKAADNG